MKRTVRNFLIELVCYIVVLAILMVVVGVFIGWSPEMLVTQIITFTLGWAVVKIVTTLLQMRDKKEDKEKAKKRKK